MQVYKCEKKQIKKYTKNFDKTSKNMKTIPRLCISVF